MADTGVFGVFRFGPSCFQGVNHFARLLDRNSLVVSAMKGPDRDVFHPGGGGWVAPATNRRRGSEQLGPLRERVPSAVATHRETADIDSFFVNWKFFPQ